MNAENAVREFCNAVARMKSAELVAFFTRDAVYHNIPIAPVRGHDEIRAWWDYFDMQRLMKQLG